MKLLHIISTMDQAAGGVSQAVNMMARYSKNLAITHEVVCLDDPQATFLKEYPFSIHALGSRKTSWSFHPALFSWLEKHLSNYRFIIVHGLWQYQSLAVLRAIARHPEVILYVMPHGMLDPYFQKAPERRLKAVRNSFFWHLIEKRLIKKADGLLFTCQLERELASQSFEGSYKPRQEHVIGLGIAPPPVRTAQMDIAFRLHVGIKPDIKYLLFLSRINPKKGVDLLVNGYLRLQKEIPDIPALVIAGPGMETEYGVEIKKLAGENGTIFFAGMIAGDIKWGAFYSCEAFILPSHQENFGIAVVEALACHKPALISDKVNIYEEVKNGNAGLVQQDDAEGTYLLLKQWMEIPASQRQAMAQNARQTFEDKFEIEKTTSVLADLLLCEGSLIK